MTEKYFIGFEEVRFAEFERQRAHAEEKGNIIISSGKEDGYFFYTLENDTVIRGDKKGGFNRIENGEVKEEWQVGTINDFVQGEAAGSGQALFFTPIG